MAINKWVLVSIDPGFGGTGMCMYVNKRLYRYANIKSKAAGMDRYYDISCMCGRLFVEWLEYMISASANALEAHIDRFDVVIESPHAFGGAKGAAALGRGDVFSVAKLVGALTYMFYDKISGYISRQQALECIHAGKQYASKYAIHHPEVRCWKGQTSKDTTERRVLRDVVYAKEYIPGTLKNYELFHGLPDHVFDAAGIGLWAIKNLECVL